jgi:hypothetical protein
MSAISALAVGTDAVPAKGTTSPVAHSVEKVQPTLVAWSDMAGAIFSLNKTTALSWRYPTVKSKIHRVTLTKATPLDRPVTDSGSNTTHIVAGTIQVKMEFIIPTLATSAERTEFFRALIQTLLDTQFKAAVSDLNFPY